MNWGVEPPPTPPAIPTLLLVVQQFDPNLSNIFEESKPNESLDIRL